MIEKNHESRIKLKIFINGKEEEIEIEKGKHLGKGRFGSVHIYQDKEGRRYAVKIGSIFRTELELMKEIYVNRIGYTELNMEYREEAGEVLVMPFLGDQLDKFLENIKTSFQQKCQIAQELSFALNDFYCRGFIHGDLKESNIAISHDTKKDTYDIALIDLSSVQDIQETKQDINSIYNDKLIDTKKMYTIQYASPERRNKKIGFKSDTFSITPVYLNIFGAIDSSQFINNEPNTKFNIKNKKNLRPLFISKFLFDFLLEMQRIDFHERPNPSQICIFFKTLNSLVKQIYANFKEQNIIDKLKIEDLLKLDNKFIIFLLKLKLLSKGKWEVKSDMEEDALLCTLIEKKFSFENVNLAELLEEEYIKSIEEFLINDKNDIFENKKIKNLYLNQNRDKYYFSDETSRKGEINIVNNILEDLKLLNENFNQEKIINIFKEKKLFIDNLKIKSPILYKKIRDGIFNLFKESHLQTVRFFNQAKDEIKENKNNDEIKIENK